MADVEENEEEGAQCAQVTASRIPGPRPLQAPAWDHCVVHLLPAWGWQTSEGCSTQVAQRLQHRAPAPAGQRPKCVRPLPRLHRAHLHSSADHRRLMTTPPASSG